MPQHDVSTMNFISSRNNITNVPSTSRNMPRNTEKNMINATNLGSVSKRKYIFPM